MVDRSSADGPLRLWDMTAAPTAAAERTFPAHQGSVRTIAVTRDSHWMLTIDGNQAARIWDLRLKDPTATS